MAGGAQPLRAPPPVACLKARPLLPLPPTALGHVALAQRGTHPAADTHPRAPCTCRPPACCLPLPRPAPPMSPPATRPPPPAGLVAVGGAEAGAQHQARLQVGAAAGPPARGHRQVRAEGQGVVDAAPRVSARTCAAPGCCLFVRLQPVGHAHAAGMSACMGLHTCARSHMPMCARTQAAGPRSHALRKGLRAHRLPQAGRQAHV